MFHASCMRYAGGDPSRLRNKTSLVLVGKWINLTTRELPSADHAASGKPFAVSCSMFGHTICQGTPNPVPDKSERLYFPGADGSGSPWKKIRLPLLFSYGHQVYCSLIRVCSAAPTIAFMLYNPGFVLIMPGSVAWAENKTMLLLLQDWVSA